MTHPPLWFNSRVFHTAPKEGGRHKEPANSQLLCYLSKLLERGLKNQLMDHVERNKLLPEHQSAYRACHSTGSALSKVTSDALLAAARGMVTLFRSLDLSAAFDCVDHSIFLLLLERAFGIIGRVLAWTSSLLHDKQFRYNSQTSELCRVTCGVPQGSVLGPVYFFLKTSDVFEIPSQHGFHIHGSADDLQLFQSCFPTDMVPLNIRFMGCLEAIQSWMTRNRLNLNAAKTEVMWMGSAKSLKNLSPPEVVFADCVFPISSHMRSLGVIIDSAFSFSDYVTRVVNTCFYQLQQIRSVRRSLTIDSAHAIVRALILSGLDYCNSLLSGFPNTLLSRLHDVMRAAARLIFQPPVQRPCQPSDARSTPLAECCIDDSIQTVRPACQCRNGAPPSYFTSCCIPVASVIGRSCLRSAASGEFLVLACSAQTLGPRAFAVSCPASWNSFPPDIRAPGISLVTKKKLKTFPLSHML